MDSSKQSTSAQTRSKLSKTFHKVIHLKASKKTISKAGFCLLIPHEHRPKSESQSLNKDINNDDETRSKNRAALEAFMAMLFAAVSAVKCAYAELQLAQFPYNGDAIQSADEAVVRELKSLSELKQSFLRKQIDFSSPYVTMLLSEIQEQQSMMKMYDITMTKMQSELETKEYLISTLRNDFTEIVANNKFLEKKLNSSGQFSILDGVRFSNLNSFNVVLHYCLRSVRCFVKLMIGKMEAASWDIDAAVKAIEPEVIFPDANHRCFAFESFVCREIFDGFNFHDFLLPNETSSYDEQSSFVFVDRFKQLKAVNPIQFLKKTPNSAFGKFVRSKYLRLVHPKMETSFSGNLGQRKLINSGEFPETEFFVAFAEMAKRIWLLHCLAFSFEQEVKIFQVGRNCRFSEVYMESVTDDVFVPAEDGGFRVAFTVVPGFKVYQTVIQSLVYLFPAGTPARG